MRGWRSSHYPLDLAGHTRWTKRLSVVAAILTVVALVGGWLMIRHYEADLPSVTELERGYHSSQITRVVARDGALLAELFTERRTIVSINELPPHVKLAVLAAEDANFYNHEGINYGVEDDGPARAFSSRQVAALDSAGVRAGRVPGDRTGAATLLTDVPRSCAQLARWATLLSRWLIPRVAPRPMTISSRCRGT